MTPAFRLARRDLRGGWSGLGLLWLCLALAVSGLAAVTSLASSLDRAIAANARDLLGGDLMLSIVQREASADEMDAMRGIGDPVRSTALRAMLVGPDGGSALAEVQAAGRDWPAAGKLSIEGARPQGRQIAMDPALARRLGVAPGRSVRLNGQDFRISGLIDELPRGGGFGFAPPAIIDAAGLSASGLIQPGSIYTTQYRITVPAGRDPKAEGKAFAARFGDAGWRVVDRNAASGGSRSLVDRLGQMLTLIALAALAIGGLGIASAASAFSATRKPRIAILKLLGARRTTLLAMLTLEVGLVAGAAILSGLAIGALVPAVVAQASTGLLPVTPDPAPQWSALGLTALFALLITIAACWTPLADAVATRPGRLLRGNVSDPNGTPHWPSWLALAAATALAVATAAQPRIAATGIAVLAAIALLFALVGWTLRRWSRRNRDRGGPILRLGIAALDRPGAATARLSLSLGLGLSLLVMLAASASSLLGSIRLESQARAPALFLLDIPREKRDEVERLASATLPGAATRLVPSLRGPVVAVNGTAVATMRDIPEGAWVLRGDRGLTFARDVPPHNRIVSGQWWPANYRGPPLISLDTDAATALGLKVGDRMTVAVLGRPIEARIASLRQIDWRSLGFNFAIIFDPHSLAAAPFTWMASVDAPPGQSTDAFEQRMAQQLPMASAVRVADIVAQVQSLLESLEGAVRLASLFAMAIGMVVLAGSVVATREARARDLVLLRLVGATGREAGASQAIEFALIAGTSALAATVTGIGAAYAVCRFLFELPFGPDWPAVLLLPVATIILASMAAMIAALPALRTSPAAGLRAL